MSSAHPNLEARQLRNRQRSKENLTLIGIMALVFLVALLIVLLNAGRWGVPTFSFTNDHGSHCTNGFVGHTCDRLTLAEVEAQSGLDLPEGAVVVNGTTADGAERFIDAQVRVPAAAAGQTRELLTGRFGECRPGVPNPLTQVPGIADVCTMSNMGRPAQSTQEAAARSWRVSLGTQGDGALLTHLNLRS